MASRLAKLIDQTPMAAGLAFFQTALLLAASAPLILAAVLGCLLFPSTTWVTRSVVLGGLAGAALGGLWWMLANVYSVPPGYLSWPVGTSLCAAGFSLGGIVGLVTSALCKRALRKIGFALIAFLLGNVLALSSVQIERTGPELLSYGNMCGPSASDNCYEPALKGGFPFAYLTDMPGVSVEHRLSFGEDVLHPAELVLDIMVYAMASLFSIWCASRVTGRSSRRAFDAR